MISTSQITKSSLLSLRANELKLLASSIGAPNGGSKDVLSSRLWQELHAPKIPNAEALDLCYSPRETKILSIDMGIKNFAYCVVTLPKRWKAFVTAPRQTARVLPKDLQPRLHAWNRLDVTSLSSSLVSCDTTGDSTSEPFHPRRLAQYANYLVKQLVLDESAAANPPDVVLIERQRFRTMGSSMVQEWTLRVNMLEAMLWSILHAERERGAWKGEVRSVSPSLVASWWESQDVSAGFGKDTSRAEPTIKKLSAKEKKKLRVKRAAICLERDIQFASSATATTYAAFTTRQLPRKVAAPHVQADGDGPPKLDDLADCLLQALAWISWEKNRLATLASGTSFPILREASSGTSPISDGLELPATLK